MKTILELVSAKGKTFNQLRVNATQSFASISNNLENYYAKSSKFLIDGKLMNGNTETFEALGFGESVRVDVIENESGG